MIGDTLTKQPSSIATTYSSFSVSCFEKINVHTGRHNAENDSKRAADGVDPAAATTKHYHEALKTTSVKISKQNGHDTKKLLGDNITRLPHLAWSCAPSRSLQLREMQQRMK
jgi:hypothetical protein